MPLNRLTSIENCKEKHKNQHSYLTVNLNMSDHGVLKASMLKWFTIPSGHVRAGPQRRLSTEELTLLNCGVGENS